uniref:FAD-binding protein n=1 Tax=Desulfobacca acetoxidans TaxID=60893 RepID=A0A7C3YZV8_9BACT
MMQGSIIKKIAAIVGPENVLTREEDRWCYAYDATDLMHLPDLVVFPGSAAEIAAIVKLANRHRFPVVPRGAGTGRAGGSVPVQGGVVLVTTRLNRILEISPEDMVAVVEPGVVTGVLKRAAVEKGLYYPPDPGSADYCTIGGNVATGAGGAMAVQHGVTRDYVLGLEVVLPTGEIIAAGSRTIKSVVGYDLTRLFLGSEGTLWVITRIVLRLVTRPASRLSLAAGFASLDAALSAVGQVLRSTITPTAIEFMDRATLACIRKMLPFSLPPEVTALLLFMVEGHPRDVAGRVKLLRQLCQKNRAPLVLQAQNEAEAEKLWAVRRSVSPATFKMRPHKVSEDVAVPLGAIAALVDGVEEISRNRDLPIICFGHAGDGNIHVNIMFDQAQPREREAAHAATEDLFFLVGRLKGTLSGEHGVGVTKAPYLGLEISEASMALQKRLKQAFDPNNIMNPGKLFPPEPLA